MPESIKEYCDNYPRDTVYWCMGNEPVLPLTMNWVKSASKCGIPMLYIALDLQTYHAMRPICPTVHIPQSDKHHVFVYKFIVGAEIMRQGKNWFYTDVDCVAQNNYMHTIEHTFAAGYDQICQAVKHYKWLGEPHPLHGEYNCGTGMYGMRATQTNIDMCDPEKLYNHGYRTDGTCQKHVNTTIKHRADTRIQLLDPLLFPEGNSFETADPNWCAFHITGKYAYEDWDNTKKYLGDSAKIESLKTLGYWYI